MQSVAGVVVIPHRTTDTRCSAGKVAIAGISAEDKKPTSPSKPSTEGKLTNSAINWNGFAIQELWNIPQLCNLMTCTDVFGIDVSLICIRNMIGSWDVQWQTAANFTTWWWKWNNLRNSLEMKVFAKLDRCGQKMARRNALSLWPS
mgnify:FL=1